MDVIQIHQSSSQNETSAKPSICDELDPNSSQNHATFDASMQKNDTQNLIEASKVAWFCAEFESSSSQIEIS
jgi:hypothetical protein